MKKSLKEQSAFTTYERTLARSGYCYSRVQFKNGLKSVVRQLDGMLRDDVIFDHCAYETHKKMGLI